MKLWPEGRTMAIASSSDGNASRTSIRRISTLSVRRRRSPAIAPMIVPMKIANPTAANPIESEIRPP